MGRNLPLEENAVNSCRSIVHFLEESVLENPEVTVIRELLMRDLCWRVSDPAIDPLDRAVVMARAFHALLPGKAKNEYPLDALRIGELERLPRRKREHKDVAIITILGKELEAILRTLGRSPKDKADQISGDFSYWFGSVRRHDGTRASIVVTLVAEPRNVPCAIAVEHVLHDFSVDLLILVGIAAGVRGKVKLGDVVAAQQVYDYEHVRLELKQLLRLLKWKMSRPRPKYIEVNRQVRTNLERYEENRMCASFAELVRQVDEDDLPQDSSDLVPAFHTGTIAAGEKLIADGSLKRMQRVVDQQIRAGAMEDSGFAQVAKIKKISWCVFRGISDYGDPRKNDKWHLMAALAAAAACVTFIRGFHKD